MFKESGQGLIEVVVAAAILAVIMGLVGIAGFTSVRRAYQAQLRTQATFLAQQGVEVIKNYKDRNWGKSEIIPDVCPAPCMQPILTPGLYNDLFFQTLGDYCVSHDTTGSARRWYLSAPLNGDKNKCTTGTLGSGSDAKTFIRYASISLDKAGHRDDSAPPDPCDNPADVHNCYIRKVVVTVLWCIDGQNVEDCSPADRDSLELVDYLYKSKDPSYG